MSLGTGLVAIQKEFLHRNKDFVEDGVCKISSSSWEEQAQAHNMALETKIVPEEISKARCIVPKLVSWAEIITSNEERIQVSPIVIKHYSINGDGFDYILWYPMARERCFVWTEDWKKDLCASYQSRHSV